MYSISGWGLLVPAVESLVSHLFARAQHRGCVFHMAMVEWKGIGLIIPGERGSGKSTLALKLAQIGAQYYGDDLILVDPAERLVHAFPKAVTLKAGAFHLFEESPTYNDPLRGPIRYVLPRTAGQHRMPLESAKIILFPDYCRAGEPLLQPLDPGWTALALVQQLFGGVEGRREALTLIAELAHRPAYVVACGDLESAGRAILARVEKEISG